MEIKKLINQQKGFTLVELLIAISILMVIIFSFTLLFTTSFSGIFGAGRKSEALFRAQEEMDNKIASGLEEQYDETTLEIKFDYLTLIVTGEVKQVDYEYEEHTDTIKYFLPAGE